MDISPSFSVDPARAASALLIVLEYQAKKELGPVVQTDPSKLTRGAPSIEDDLADVNTTSAGVTRGEP